jgi:uncharacterized RDD family membrane protein YckC
MEWYYLRDGKTMGPVPDGSIRAWLDSGFLSPEDLLWRVGMAQWLPVVELTEFGGSGGPEHAGGPADESGASGAHVGEAPTDAPGGPDGASPATGGPGGVPSSVDGPGGTLSSAGGPGGAYADTTHGQPGASSWGRSRAEWSEAPATYANIWARAGAAAIDLMLLVAAVLVVFRPELPTTGNIEDMTKLNPAITPVFMAIAWLYFGLMEGSVLQASLGKLAFGLKVTDLDGNRLLPGRALARGLLKVVLMEITAFLSFLPAAFTSRRQALHDMVAGSTVLVR